MVNRLRLIALVAAATALAMVAALSPVAAQSDDETEAAAAEEVQPALQLLTRADTFGAGAWELSVGEAFTIASPTVADVTEVRVAVTMRNTSESDAAYRPDGFFSDPSYPRLAIRDGSGTERPLRAARSLEALLPGSTLHSVPPGLTGRWTVGFDVPSAFATDLELVVHGLDGSAAFDLASSAAAASYGPPDSLPRLGIGDEFDWAPGLEATATDHGTMVCGDPDRQLVAAIVAVSFSVENTTSGRLDWPGVDFPATLAIAQWADGTSARHSSETYVGDVDDGFTTAGPGQTFQRALLFAAPRDSRVGSVADDPIGVWMNTPGGSPMWLALDGPGDLRLDPTLCDEGLFPFTIPGAFGPGPAFTVGNFPPLPDPAAQDLEARQLLSEALVVAARYRSANDGSYVGMTASTLRAIWDGITYNDGFAPDVGEVGVVASTEETEAGDVVRGVLVTESGSGAFFCVSDGPEGVTFGSGATLLEAEAVCDPASAAAKAAAEAAAAQEEAAEEEPAA
jgi:hypothetical protein